MRDPIARLQPDIQLDIYLSDHVDTLYEMIREKVWATFRCPINRFVSCKFPQPAA
jgi:hypothetical protein